MVGDRHVIALHHFLQYLALCRRPGCIRTLSALSLPLVGRPLAEGTQRQDDSLAAEHKTLR